MLPNRYEPITQRDYFLTNYNAMWQQLETEYGATEDDFEMILSHLDKKLDEIKKVMDKADDMNVGNEDNNDDTVIRVVSVATYKHTFKHLSKRLYVTMLVFPDDVMIEWDDVDHEVRLEWVVD